MERILKMIKLVDNGMEEDRKIAIEVLKQEEMTFEKLGVLLTAYIRWLGHYQGAQTDEIRERWDTVTDDMWEVFKSPNCLALQDRL